MQNKASQADSMIEVFTFTGHLFTALSFPLVNIDVDRCVSLLGIFDAVSKLSSKSESDASQCSM